MKKIIIILLCIVFAFSFSACGQAAIEDPSSGNNTPTKEAQYQNEDSEDTDIEENHENPNEDIKLTDTKTDSGRYNGQADNNFIEIKISGVPDNMDPVVFMLSEEAKEQFSVLKLDTEQPVKFDYYINENDQKVITKIEKI